jgi:hypothetical protein
MIKKELGPDIWAIEDFLSKEELDQILTLAKSKTQEEWEYQYSFDIEQHASQDNKFKAGDPEFDEAVKKKNVFWNDKMIAIGLPELTPILTTRTLEAFDNKYRINEIARIQRQYPGTELKVHHDQGYDLTLQRAVIIYLNDDYEGGELYFTQHDLRVKPKAGTLVSFPGTDKYLHGVANVLPGETRYVISTFAFEKETDWTQN